MTILVNTFALIGVVIFTFSAIVSYQKSIDCSIIYVNETTYNPNNDKYEFGILYNIPEYGCNGTHIYDYMSENKATEKMNQISEKNIIKCRYFSLADQGPCSCRVDYNNSAWCMFLAVDILVGIAAISYNLYEFRRGRFWKKNEENETETPGK